MACALTQGYNLDCRDSFGGLKEVYIGEWDSLTFEEDGTPGLIESITKATGKRFYKYNLIAHTGEGDEVVTSSRENGTNPNKQTVKFPINKMTVAVRNELLLLMQNRLAIIIVENNGQALLYGKDFGMMTTTISAKTGKELKDRNGYEFVFESDEKYLAPFVDPSLISTLETPGS